MLYELFLCHPAILQLGYLTGKPCADGIMAADNAAADAAEIFMHTIGVQSAAA